MLTSQDLNEIKRLDDLATCIQSNNSYLSAPYGFVNDTSENPALEIPETDALRASEFRQDMIPPMVTGFDIDMNSGLLTIYFSETVNSSTLQVSSFSIQNAMQVLVLTDDTSYQLTSGRVMTLTSDLEGDHTLIVKLSEVDINALKHRLMLASSSDDTFLTVQEGGCRQDRRKDRIRAANRQCPPDRY